MSQSIQLNRGSHDRHGATSPSFEVLIPIPPKADDPVDKNGDGRCERQHSSRLQHELPYSDLRIRRAMLVPRPFIGRRSGYGPARFCRPPRPLHRGLPPRDQGLAAVPARVRDWPAIVRERCRKLRAQLGHAGFWLAHDPPIRPLT